MLERNDGARVQVRAQMLHGHHNDSSNPTLDAKIPSRKNYSTPLATGKLIHQQDSDSAVQSLQ